MRKNRGGGARGFAEVSKARLGKAQSREMLDYVWTPYADIDPENVAAMIRCNMAHTVMLCEQGIISRREASGILGALRALQRRSRSFPFDPVKGDLFFNVEAHVIARAGPDIGGKMHLGRSRIDLIAALMRLKVRKNLTRLLAAVMAFRKALLSRARTTADVVMPSYTHLQPAQVTTFGHYLVAFHDVVTRDLQRLLNAFVSTNASPLGAAAASGTSWPLDRRRVAELLGFSSVIENTKDAAHNYDWLPEVMAAAGILMSNVARVATDLYIWCSNEFALVELDGAFAASSSIMPQKKNPYSLEMIKARTGEVTTAFGAILEILKGDTGGTAFDVKLTGPRIADNAVNRAADMVALMTPLLKTLRLNRERMAESAGDGFTTAVALADTLVEHGLSFRTAHHIVGRLVRLATERGLGYRDVDRALVDEAARDIIGKDIGLSATAIKRALDPDGFVRSRRGNGGPAPGEVRRMIASRERQNAKWERAVGGAVTRIADADRRLIAAVERLSRG
ncbi:MAG: argininosuccinate lyase [Betaproteobacteria bacterium]|nr:argininosuccinate lyase [Betaproteobacteria bacterium]